MVIGFAMRLVVSLELGFFLYQVFLRKVCFMYLYGSIKLN